MPDEADKPKERVPFVYKPLSAEQLEQLAQDIAAGRVFHSGMCENTSDIAMVFMPLGLMGDNLTFAEMIEQKVTVFYEYLDKAGPRSVNGMPCFFSMHMLNLDQALIVQTKILEITALLKARRDATTGVDQDAEGPDERS
jgi:hypothetical protein